MKSVAKKSKNSKQLAKEDMQYLQKKISGRSVYKGFSCRQSRRPKHMKMFYQYTD